jgi:hypothetical protein
MGLLAAMGLLGFGAYLASSSSAEEAEQREVHIEWADELKDGEMRTIQVGEKNDQKVLISRF